MTPDTPLARKTESFRRTWHQRHSRYRVRVIEGKGDHKTGVILAGDALIHYGVTPELSRTRMEGCWSWRGFRRLTIGKSMIAICQAAGLDVTYSTDAGPFGRLPTSISDYLLARFATPLDHPGRARAHSAWRWRACCQITRWARVRSCSPATESSAPPIGKPSAGVWSPMFP